MRKSVQNFVIFLHKNHYEAAEQEEGNEEETTEVATEA